MSCPDFVFSARGRQGLGVIQPQSGLDYPFVEPSVDVRYLIADLHFSYDDPGLYQSGVPLARHPLKIKWLYGLGCDENEPIAGMPTPTHAADILITDADDNVVFDSTNLGAQTEPYQKFTTRPWGDDYIIYEWTSPQATCRLVAYATWAPDEHNPQHYPQHLAPSSATLDERAVYKIPKRVKSLSVLTATAKRTPVVFKAGYNMRLTPTPAETVGLRNRTEIDFSVVEGAGFGQYSDCQDDKPKYIYTINGVGPNQYGDFFISAADCLYGRVATAAAANNLVTPLTHTGITIGADCPPCCDCPDYVATATYMNQIRDRYVVIGQRTKQVKVLHENNIDRWIAQRACRVKKPLRISLSPLSCPYMEVIMQFCNQCPECVEDVVLNVNLESFPLGAVGEVVPGYTVINAPNIPNESFELGGSWPNFYAYLGFVDKGASAFVRFVLKFTPRNFSYSITGTLTGTIKGAPITPCDPDFDDGTISQAIDTRALYCNQTGCTDVGNSFASIVVLDSSFTEANNELTLYVNAAAASGATVFYQWQYSDDDVAWATLADVPDRVVGATTNTLQIAAAERLEQPTRKYRVLLSADNTRSRTFAPAPIVGEI